MKILINAMVVSPASWIKYVTLNVTFGTSQLERHSDVQNPRVKRECDVISEIFIPLCFLLCFGLCSATRCSSLFYRRT